MHSLGTVSFWVGVCALVTACADGTQSTSSAGTSGPGAGSGSGATSSGGSSGGRSGSNSGSGSSSGSSGATSSGSGSTGGGTSSGSTSGGTRGGSSSGTGTGSSSGGSGAGSGTSSSGSTGSGSGSSSGSSGGAPSGSSPVIGGCSVFPPDNPWNTRIDDRSKFPVHANSATYIAHMAPSTALHPDWGDWSTDHYGIPWQTVPGSQPMVKMTFSDPTESDPGPYPFPPNALVEGGANSGGDMHVLVVDTGTCTLYETWQSTRTGSGWSCGSGAKFDLTSNGLRTDGWTSADAAGLPILPGLVRLAEVQAGSIQHALRFTVSSTQQGYIHPATHAAGSSDPSLPPMGLRVRLKAGFDLSPFSGPAKVILVAMQQYGLILADNGGDWYVSGDSDDGWSSMMDPIAQALSQVKGSDFEAVETGPISTAGL